MKRLYIFASLALAGTIFLVEYDLSQRIQKRNLNSNRNSLTVKSTSVQKPLAEAKTQAAAVSTVSYAATDDSFFESTALKLAQKLSSNQVDPKTLDQKMDQLAKGLTPLEIKKLAIIVHNKNESEDRRAMAVELLSRSKTADAVLLLKEFVASKQTSALATVRKRELESILRAQAIEGIAGYPKKELALSYLNTLENQVEEKFLKDRIVRSEEGLKGRAPNTQQKEEAALKQLVQ